MCPAEQKLNKTGAEDGNSCVFAKNQEIGQGDIVQVIDNLSGRTIIQGEVTGLKDSVTSEKRFNDHEKLFSIDDKHFFKLDDDAYTIKKLDTPYVDEDYICANYKMAPWHHYNNVKREEVNFFRENSVDELDKEVEDVIRALNKFSPYMLTTGSCSGHGEEQAWVTIRFKDLLTINDFLNVLTPYNSKLDLTTDANINTVPPHFAGNAIFPRDVDMQLKTKEVGKPAWRALDEFTEYLYTIIDLRKRFWNLQNKLINRERDRIIREQDQQPT